MVLSFTNTHFAEDQSNLAKFLIRNFDPLEVPTVGSNDPDYVIVEFFDYRCGYCKRVFSTIQALLKEDGNIRYVLKELPILGPDSIFASQAALAVWNTTPEKYLSFHGALMASRGNLSAEKVMAVAKNLALDVDALTKSMKNKSVNTKI